MYRLETYLMGAGWQQKDKADSTRIVSLTATKMAPNPH